MSQFLGSLFDAALSNNQFGLTSRYYGIEKATFQAPDGRTIAYVRRRFLPPGSSFSVLQDVVVREGDRLDQLAATYLGDAEQSWRLCDANDAMNPADLLREPGTVIHITLPQGMTGPTDA